MVYKNCCVRGCTTGQKGSALLRCHKFPTRGFSNILVKRPNGEELWMDRREVWKGVLDVKAVKYDTVVCARHFKSSDYTSIVDKRSLQLQLSPDAVPTCNLPGRQIEDVKLKIKDHVVSGSELILDQDEESSISLDDSKHTEEDQGQSITFLLDGITDEKYRERLKNLHILNEIHNYCAYRIADRTEVSKTLQKRVPKKKAVTHSTPTTYPPLKPAKAKTSATKTTRIYRNANLLNGSVVSSSDGILLSVRCCVYGCSSLSDNNPSLSFHKFPDRGSSSVVVTGENGKPTWMDRRDVWRAMLRRADIAAGMRVCSKHFVETDFIHSKYKGRTLHYTALPSQNLPEVSADTKVISNDQLSNNFGDCIMMQVPLEKEPGDASEDKNLTFIFFKSDSLTTTDTLKPSELHPLIPDFIMKPLNNDNKMQSPSTRTPINAKETDSVLENLLQSNSDCYTSEEQILVESAILNTPIEANIETIIVDDDEMAVESPILYSPVEGETETDIETIIVEDDDMPEVKTELITIEEEQIMGLDEQDAFLNQIDMYTTFGRNV